MSSFLLALSASGQRVPIHPEAQKAVIALGNLSSTQRWNGKRIAMTHNMTIRLACNMRVGTDTFVRVWDNLDGISFALGASGQSTALLIDNKRRTTGTIVTPMTYYDDSLKSDGITGYYKTGFTLTSGTVTDQMYTFVSTTQLPAVPANIKIEMGGLAVTNSARMVLGILASGGSSFGSGRYQNYSSGNVTYSHPSLPNSSGAWSNYRTSSTNIRVMREQTVYTNVTNTAGNFAPGEIGVFKVADGAFAISDKGCKGFAFGYSFTDVMTASLHRTFLYKSNNL